MNQFTVPAWRRLYRATRPAAKVPLLQSFFAGVFFSPATRFALADASSAA
jgi:hypothetical protein